MNVERAAAAAWYREPWPWILMAGPAAVVVAGALTAWIAFSTADGLVADDYYKQGLAINQVLRREHNAARLGVAAKVEFGEEFHRIRVLLVSASQPAELRVRLAHATRAGHDLTLRLARTGDRRYEAAVPKVLPAGRWQVGIEDPFSDWRLSGDWSGRESAFSLSPGDKERSKQH